MARVRGDYTARNSTSRVTAPALDADELVKEDQGAVLFNDGNEREELDEVQEIEPVHDVLGAKEKADALAFNEEEMVIIIHESTDENAEKYVYLSVNGQGPGPGNIPWVPRAIPVKMKRKFVEVLCRARPVAYGSVEKINPMGERYIEYPKASALRYPFSVVTDPNPRGGRWLQALLSGKA